MTTKERLAMAGELLDSLRRYKDLLNNDVASVDIRPCGEFAVLSVIVKNNALGKIDGPGQKADEALRLPD